MVTTTMMRTAGATVDLGAGRPSASMTTLRPTFYAVDTSGKLPPGADPEDDERGMGGCQPRKDLGAGH